VSCLCKRLLSNQNLHYYANNSLQLAFMPAESAIARCDDVIQLLIALNADISFITKESMYSPRFLLDWVRFSIQSLSKQIEQAKENQVPPPPTITTSGWKGYLHYQTQYFKHLKAKPLSSVAEKRINDQRRELIEKKAYFVDVERLLVSREAQTGVVGPAKIGMVAPVSPVDDQTPRYFLLKSGYYGNTVVPQHLVPSYDELFEACYTGNNEKIQQLCFTKTKVQPLQIAVRISAPNEIHGSEGGDQSPNSCPKFRH
jgi:hypothetical protein